MKIELKNVPNENLTTTEQILFNRGITDIDKYIHTTIEDIAEPELLGEDLLKRAYGFLRDAIVRNEDVVVIVDADCDGFTSAAVIINYLYISYKEWATYHLHYLLHEGKQHGLSDHLQTLLQSNYSLIIVPDGGTNDVNECNALSMLNKKVIVLDHHEKEVDNNCAIIINSTLNGYPNNQLSGAGVAWQFCRYIDKLLNKEYNLANEFIDLTAIGAQGDMMSLRSLETKALIWEGLRQRNIKNPLISGLIEKNDFSLNKAEYKSSYLKISPMGASFFVVPLINACVRSGTMEEKDLIFKSMLNQYAFEEILSNKRGHKVGEKEERVTQALRTLTNVKNRQTKAQDAGMALLEKKIVEQDMLKHKVLLFTLEPGQIDANVAGLAANKIMGKYQRPVCVLTLRDSAYQGSARGCNAVGVTEFKTMCEYTELTEYTVG